ncbi:MAG: flavin reductase [Pseudarcicella sp.]|jgi:flavin reductase (DIM6/NTAB) family NADH-FMN oxidoreductase RutF|nr:flavin reductase [Pseudarcicella sp.]MBP6409879.1 flavin reductase [Pseudarcicella sp.]
MNINQQQLSEMPDRYRAVFLNSLAGTKQAFLIGTTNLENQYNLAIFNSLIHFGANPPLWGFVCRPETVKRDTLQNIIETGFYTINYVNTNYVEQAHQTSAKYPKNISEFEACGFTPEFLEAYNVPFVKEAEVKILMKFQEKVDISNGTVLVLGAIEQISLSEDLLSEDGFVDFEKAQILSCVGLDAYYQTSIIKRMPYARPTT